MAMANKLQAQIPDELHDMGDDRGFGGAVGANRHIPPYDHSKVETLPRAYSVDYGEEPGRNKTYGSRGIDQPVSMKGE